MTKYVHRVTAFVPTAKRSDANQLAACIGESMADVNTYGEPRYRDAQGNLYSVMSTAATPALLEKQAVGTAVRPAFDSEETLDLVAAQRALDSVVIYTGTEQATPDTILAIIDIDPQQAIQLAGVELIEETI